MFARVVSSRRVRTTRVPEPISEETSMRALPAAQLFAAIITVSVLSAAAVGHRGSEASISEPAASVPSEALSAQPPQVRSRFTGADSDVPHSFYFTRAAYGRGGGFGFRGPRWQVDYPDADVWIAGVLNRLTGIDVSPWENPVLLDDPDLRRFPFVYAVEVGYMSLAPSEEQGLRDYLLAGGFLFADDFWGTYEWQNFEYQMRQVLPEYEIVEIPLDHPVFSSFYQIDEIIQVPNVGQGIRGGPTHEQDGFVPYCLGIFDEHGRLMVVINYNTDLGDAWEWAEDPRYPLTYSTYAYQMAANFIVYAMTH